MPQPGTELRFFQEAGFDATSNRFRHAGMADDGHLVGTISIAEHDLSLAAIDEAFQQLVAMHEAVR